VVYGLLPAWTFRHNIVIRSWMMLARTVRAVLGLLPREQAEIVADVNRMVRSSEVERDATCR
jgi:hypothetical protein